VEESKKGCWGFFQGKDLGLSITVQRAEKGRGFPEITKLRKHQLQSSYLYSEEGP